MCLDFSHLTGRPQSKHILYTITKPSHKCEPAVSCRKNLFRTHRRVCGCVAARLSRKRQRRTAAYQRPIIRLYCSKLASTSAKFMHKRATQYIPKVPTLRSHIPGARCRPPKLSSCDSAPARTTPGVAYFTVSILCFMPSALERSTYFCIPIEVQQ